MNGNYFRQLQKSNGCDKIFLLNWKLDIQRVHVYHGAKKAPEKSFAQILGGCVYLDTV